MAGTLHLLLWAFWTPIVLMDQCGKSQVFPKKDKGVQQELYVIGGESATKGMFPWVGYIVFDAPKGLAECTVNLIKPTWAVTAAHCLIGDCAETSYVILGIVNVDDLNNKNIYEVKRLIHPRELKLNTRNNIPLHDIALIELKRPVDVKGSNGTVGFICLPDKSHSLAGEYYLAGWGITEDDGFLPSDTLKYLKAHSVSHERCFHPTSICMKSKKRNETVYRGDSGGPAMKLHNGRFYLYGVLSAGNKKNSYFTRVSDYLSWIEKMPKDGTITMACKKGKKKD